MSQTYIQAHAGSVYYRIESSSYLQLSGPDRIDFLQRQSTNDLRKLEPGQVIQTVLTSPTARILDVLYAFASGEDLHIIPLPGHAAQTAKFLKSKIFFMDKVEVTDLSEAYTQIDVFGPTAVQTLDEAGFGALPEIGQSTEDEIAGTAVRVLGLAGLTSAVTYRLVIPEAAGEQVIEQLQASGVAPVSRDTFEVLRIEAGLPGPEGELTEDYTPLEANLSAAISDAKGCYTGQEVLARQVNYDKITRALVKLRLVENVETGAKIYAADKNVGTLTSTAQSPGQGAIALGIIKRPYNNTGTEVQIAGANGKIQAFVEEIA
jgi:folate-binding protein YgfZ